MQLSIYLGYLFNVLIWRKSEASRAMSPLQTPPFLLSLSTKSSTTSNDFAQVRKYEELQSSTNRSKCHTKTHRAWGALFLISSCNSYHQITVCLPMMSKWDMKKNILNLISLLYWGYLYFPPKFLVFNVVTSRHYWQFCISALAPLPSVPVPVPLPLSSVWYCSILNVCVTWPWGPVSAASFVLQPLR